MSETGSVNVLNKSWEQAVPLLKEWVSDLETRIGKHRQAGKSLRFWNRTLGGLNVVLAAVTSTTVFAALDNRLQALTTTDKVLVTAVSVLPAISAGLQKEFQLAAREQNHMAKIQDYRSLIKQLTFILVLPSDNPRQEIKTWIDRYDTIMDKTPFGHKL
jgi:hypothetical protein